MRKKDKLADKTWDRYLPVIAIFLFSFILYGNTLTHDYALDDLIVIQDNKFVQKGFSGINGIFSYDSFTGFFGKEKKLVAGGRYRPLSLASFAIEYGIIGEKDPTLSHLLNVLFYALTGVLIFLCFSGLWNKNNKDKWYLTIPFITAILFIAHPLHTEAVANIKGRDEIFALLFSLLALHFAIVFWRKSKIKYMIYSAISLFLGLLSKENAILFILIIPLTLFFFKKATVSNLIRPVIFLLIPGILFIVIRGMVLGNMFSSDQPAELLNNPFLDATLSQKYGTMLYSLGIYLKLLFIPYPLTHDYYPWHIPLIPVSDLKALVSMIIYLAIILYAILTFSRRSIISYGILYYLITLSIVSNLFFSIGTIMNERFLYMPSLGFCLVVAWFFIVKIPQMTEKKNAVKFISAPVLIIILVAFSVQTVARNRVWKDDFTLFTTDVMVSKNSTKCNTSAGGQYIEKAISAKDSLQKKEYFNNAFYYLEEALKIYPENINGILLLGNARVLAHHDLGGGIQLYMKVLSKDPQQQQAYANAVKVLMAMDFEKNLDLKFSASMFLFKIDPENGQVNYLLGRLYGQYKGKTDSACYFLERATRILPDDPAAWKDIGILYAMHGSYDKAFKAFDRAIQLDPADKQLQEYLNVTRLNLVQKK